MTPISELPLGVEALYDGDGEQQESTELGVLSVARFCYVFACELRGPAWAVGSYSR